MLRRFFNAFVTWAGLLVSAAAVIWLARSVDWRGSVAAFEDAQWLWLAPAPLLLITNFLLRAVRWTALFPRDMHPRLSSAFTSMMAGYLFNNILPGRAGELVRVHMLGRREQLPRSAALGTVVVERTLDLLVLLALLAAVLLSQPLPGWAAYAGKVVALLALIALAGVLFVGLLGERIVALSLPWLSFLPEPVRARLDVSGRAFVSGVAGVLRAPVLVRFLLLTAPIWALELLLVWSLAQAFGLALGPVALLFVMLAIASGTMVPASPGYIGTFEFFGVNALSLLGVTGSAALSFVVCLHAVLLLGSSLLGAACVAWPRRTEVLAEAPAGAREAL